MYIDLSKSSSKLESHTFHAQYFYNSKDMVAYKNYYKIYSSDFCGKKPNKSVTHYHLFLCEWGREKPGKKGKTPGLISAFLAMDCKIKVKMRLGLFLESN